MKYKPGLVGGHCISVDPYYLAHKATQLGYHPNVILSGRRVNDSVAEFIASKVVKLMIGKDISIKNASAIILGVTFKENCPDVRNTKVVDVFHALKDYGVKVDIYDPWADEAEVKHEYGVDILSEIKADKKYDAIVLAVSHNEFLTMDLNGLKNKEAVVYDIKACLDRSLVDSRL
ncbi:UDP-N-acetyl-D-glucosamine 6-dehydrogenase [compost metagenome]